MGWMEVADVTNEELVARIKAGIDVPENMLQLWEQTRAFIHTVALRYQGYADMEDLEQEGYLALYDAVDGYSQEGGRTFLSYASFWIRQRMKRYIDNCCQTVRIPVHEQGRLHQYRKMANAFQICLGREPTEWEVSHNLHLDGKQRRDLESAMRAAQVGSLDAALLEDGDGGTVGDMVPSSTDVEADALDRLQQEQLQAVIWPMVDRLPGRQPDVIRKRYQEGMTLKEIGEAYGVNLNAIRQSERDGLRALRRSRDSGKLRAFLPELLEPQAYRHNGAREFDRTWESSTERVAMKLLEKCH